MKLCPVEVEESKQCSTQLLFSSLIVGKEAQYRREKKKRRKEDDAPRL